MSKFVAGFAVASLLWGGAAALYLAGVIGPGPGEVVTEPLPEEEPLVEAPPEGPTKRRRWRRRGAGGASEAIPTGNATTGDDLGGLEPLDLDLDQEGGEQQLSAAQVEAAIDPVFPRIRRCMVLAAGDDLVRGRLTFGFRISPNGSVAAVNLSGPAALTTGEAGECLRTAGRSVRFPSFDGPPMIVRYPVSLE